MDDDIADRVKSCNQCQLTRHAPQPAPLHPWEWPDLPWVHLYAHSKWLEVMIVNSAHTTNTIEHFRSLFATHSLP